MHKKVDEFIANPRKALFTLAWPVLIAMVVQTMYSIVDTAYVGRLGSEAIAALTFSFPLFFILMGINSGIAVGMGSLISRHLGAKNKEGAENTAIHGLLISIVAGLIIFLPIYFNLLPIFSFLGAKGNVLRLSIDYMSIILLGVFFMFLSFTQNGIFASQGDTKTPMTVQLSGLILNIILDPIFIYGLKMGVKGAAIATVISFALSFIMYIYFTTRKSYLKIHPSSFKFSMKIFYDIFAVGIPATIMMLLLSVYIMFINSLMAHFGTDYVAAFGIASRLESVAIMPVMAITMSMVTLVGMFYGAKRFDILRSFIWYGIKINILFTFIVGALFFIIPHFLMRIFTDEVHLIAIGIPYLRIDALTLPFMAVGMAISRVMQGMGSGIPGLVINLIRIIFVAVPLAYLFVYTFNMGYLSIVVAMVIGGIASVITAVTWLELKLKKLNNKNNETPAADQ